MANLESHHGSVLLSTLRDDFQRFALLRFWFGKGGDAFVQGGQKPAPPESETQQIGIHHLLMTDQSRARERGSLGKRLVIRPEQVVLRGCVGGQQTAGFAWRHCITGKRGVRHNTDETRLGKRAGRPALRTLAGKPLHRQVVPRVARPEQRDQHVGIKEITFQAILRLLCGARRPL